MNNHSGNIISIEMLLKKHSIEIIKVDNLGDITI
jgi:hypothetical protein